MTVLDFAVRAVTHPRDNVISLAPDKRDPLFQSPQQEGSEYDGLLLISWLVGWLVWLTLR